MVKALKVSIEALENKRDKKENTEIKEIIDAQTVIDEILVANTDAIKRTDKEIKERKLFMFSELLFYSPFMLIVICLFICF